MLVAPCCCAVLCLLPTPHARCCACFCAVLVAPACSLLCLLLCLLRMLLAVARPLYVAVLVAPACSLRMSLRIAHPAAHACSLRMSFCIAHAACARKVWCACCLRTQCSLRMLLAHARSACSDRLNSLFIIWDSDSATSSEVSLAGCGNAPHSLLAILTTFRSTVARTLLLQWRGGDSSFWRGSSSKKQMQGNIPSKKTYTFYFYFLFFSKGLRPPTLLYHVRYPNFCKLFFPNNWERFGSQIKYPIQRWRKRPLQSRIRAKQGPK